MSIQRRRDLRAALTTGVAIAALVIPTVPASAVPTQGRATNDPSGQLTRTPPMGFNDWAGFECNSRLNEKLFTDTADQIVKLGLDKLGYNYVNIDDCWMQHDRDALGNLQVDATRFPHGMKWLGDYIHSKGLKFGTYEDAGYKTCQGAAGSYGHFQADADLYASWGIDYLKLDYCYQPTDAFPGKTDSQVAQIVYHQASEALLNTGRPIVFSESAPAYVCCTGKDFTDELKWLPDEGQLWRFGSDIYDAWASVLQNYGEANTPGLPAHGGPGHWNDADMLEIGNGGMTTAEYQSQFNVWAEMASPLLLSTDLSKLTPEQVAVVSNRDVIAVDQDKLGVQGKIVQSGTGYDVLSRPLANGDVAVTLFNKGDTAKTISTNGKTVGLGSAPFTLKDLVSKKVTTSAGTIAANVAPHGTVMYRISKHASPGAAPSVAVTISNPTPGAGSTPVTVTVADNGTQSINDLDVKLTGPADWKIIPGTQSVRTVDAGRSRSVTFGVTVPPPPPGKASNTLTAAATYRAGRTHDSIGAQQTLITNTPYASLAQATNNVAITDESTTAPGNFDGDGDSYSAQALAAAGAAPGATVTHNGVAFTWPSAAAGSKDNVVADGQIVTMSGQGSKLAFLGAEAGATTGTVTVTYTDGTSSTGTLGFPNWCCTDQKAYGAEPAIATDHRNTPSGPANQGTAYDVFYNSIPITAGKTIAAVTLPYTPAIHVFAVTAA
ncbi:MAG: Alpha-galactosidase [Amycolatopsis sp.]|uniref:NEW3 domain-containing protein n=1 Tax=Amycolatopsis sp. TaxID=37632 RepID=UPI002637FE69|nr:NEW3 domain-containing protein [Amycolatopsis sp.]MCU1681471.1 Alpha-galactosidase [Amycolatopsis sp.]